MNRLARIALVVTALAAAGCDRLGLTPAPAESAPPLAEPAAAPDLRPHVGQTYAAFAAAAPQYAPQGLGLSETDAARFAHAMAQPAPGWTASGGGAEALVFTGCAAEGCAAGRAVLAVDLATGQPFAGVRDGEGATELSVNDRVEVLLRLSAPNGQWDDPRPAETPAAAAAP